MLEIIINKSKEICGHFENKLSSIRYNNTGKSENQCPGLSHSAPIDVFNQSGKRTQSGLFQIDWDYDSSTQDD